MANEKLKTSASRIDDLKVLEVTANTTPAEVTPERVLAGSFSIVKSSGTGVISISHSASGPWFPADGLSSSADDERSYDFSRIFIKSTVSGDTAAIMYHSTGEV